MIVLFPRSAKPRYFRTTACVLSDSTPLKKIDNQDDERNNKEKVD